MQSAFIYNVIIDSVGIAVVAMVLRGEYKAKYKSSFDRLLLVITLCIMAALFTDILAWLLDGMKIIPRALLLSINMVYYTAQILFSYFFMLFVEYWNFLSISRLKRLQLPFTIPLAVELALIITNPFTGWVFTISAENVYTRGRFYYANLAPYIFYVVCAVFQTLYVVICSKNERRRRQAKTLLLFMALPVFALMLNSMYYGIACLWPCVALMVMMIFQDSQQQALAEERIRAAAQAENAARLKAELTESHMAIMLSQIQPHFLYNALGVIQELCHVDPPLAERATTEFASFLRGNLDSLSMAAPIEFERELEHTRHYLELEKLRFEDRLKVAYDIRATAFRLPTLTLQPMVENAVRYGVTKRECGGTVTIASFETPKAYIVTVSDDGLGFCKGAELSNDRAHIGIQNVRDRLERMCGGTLNIESAPDAGTTVTITIPKEG